MKKILLLACSLGALMACNRDNLAVPNQPEDFPAVNEVTKGSIPVHLRISGGITTKATSANAKEDEIINALLTVTGLDSDNKEVFVDKYDVSGSAEVIINLKECVLAKFTVESGSVKDGELLKGLEDQKTHYYAKGVITMKWSDLQAAGATHEIELIRQINKITIEKISVDWNNENYAGKELRIKRIYLSDVPRYPNTTYADVVQSVYDKTYTGSKVDFEYYNFAGLETFTHKPNNVTYVSDIHRLDDQLLDEVDAVVSESSPYQTQHTFYAYISDHTHTTPKMKFMQGSRYAFLPPMTTIVIEAELGGTLMYYRFPILQKQEGTTATVPVNTHIRFQELIIKDLGSPTLYGDKTFENVNFTLVDWTDDSRTGSTENI